MKSDRVAAPDCYKRHMAAKGIHQEEALGKVYDLRLLRKLLPFVRPNRKLLVWAIVLALGQIALEQAEPIFVMAIVDGPFANFANAGADHAPAWRKLYELSAIFAGVLILGLVLRYAAAFALQRLGHSVVLRLRSALYRHMQSLSLGFYDRNPVGRLVTRTASDIEKVGEIFSSGLIAMLTDVIKIVAILILMLVLNAKLALALIAFFPVMFIVTSWFRTQARNAFRELVVKQSALNAFLAEGMNGLAVTRSFAQEARQAARYRTRNEEYRRSAFAAVMNFAVFFPVVQLIAAAATVVLLWYGASLLIAQDIEPGILIAFFLYTERLFRPIREVGEKYALLQSAMASTERIFAVLEQQDDVPEPTQPHIFDPHHIRGEIEFRNVWFAYGRAPHEGKASDLKTDEASPWVLKDVSFRVKPGELVALVGATGSGKSTIINLICRFYDPQRGTILIDGIDLREMRREDLRATSAVILQDVFLFAGSVLENLRLGDTTISRQRVIEAAQVARASHFIERLPQGYDSELAERGATLSTGQKQLIAFARALATDRPMLLLDEATANIDSETEALIQQGIEELTRNRTTVAVAHRLSTIRGAAQILVLERGEIVERGTHESLLAQRGRYFDLHRRGFDDAAQAGVSPVR